MIRTLIAEGRETQIEDVNIGIIAVAGRLAISNRNQFRSHTLPCRFTEIIDHAKFLQITQLPITNYCNQFLSLHLFPF